MIKTPFLQSPQTFLLHPILHCEALFTSVIELKASACEECARALLPAYLPAALTPYVPSSERNARTFPTQSSRHPVAAATPGRIGAHFMNSWSLQLPPR
jgi:hypothetical protein